MIALKDNLNIIIALVWAINGFACKVLGLAPRHQEIVAQILGQDHDFLFTKLIGLGEMALAIWILSGYKHKASTWIQVVLVMTMNIIEFIKVRDLLLFGRMNLVFALMFASFLLFNEYLFKPKPQIA